MRFFLFLLVLVVALVVNITITSVPLVLSVLLAFGIAQKRHLVFSFATISGILLDIFLLRTLSVTGLFFIVVLFIAFLYQRKIEVSSIYFMIIFTLFSSIVYLFLFTPKYILLQSLVATGVGSICFLAFRPEAKTPLYGGGV